MKAGPQAEITGGEFVRFPYVHKDNKTLNKHRNNDDPHLNTTRFKKENINNDSRAQCAR